MAVSPSSIFFFAAGRPADGVLVKTLLRFLLLCLVTFPAAGSELWDRAVDIYSRNADLVPGRMYAYFVQFNGRGHLVNEVEAEYTISLDENGEMVSELVYMNENGSEGDAEADAASGASGGGEAGAMSGLQLSPFDPDQQRTVTIGREGMTERIGGRIAIAVPYRHQPSDESTIAGTAWLSVEDGTPLRLTYTLDPLPRFVDRIEVTQEFATDEDRWMVASVEFEADFRILFVRRSLESRMEFSEYFRAPE